MFLSLFSLTNKQYRYNRFQVKGQLKFSYLQMTEVSIVFKGHFVVIKCHFQVKAGETISKHRVEVTLLKNDITFRIFN